MFVGTLFGGTSSSWLNSEERLFRELSEKAIRRGSFVSVPDLKEAIEEFMQAWNQNHKPFIWTATVEDIIKKFTPARAKVEQIKPRDGLAGSPAQSFFSDCHSPSEKGDVFMSIFLRGTANIAAEFSLAGRPENHEDRPTTEANVRTGGA